MNTQSFTLFTLGLWLPEEMVLTYEGQGMGDKNPTNG